MSFPDSLKCIIVPNDPNGRYGDKHVYNFLFPNSFYDDDQITIRTSIVASSFQIVV